MGEWKHIITIGREYGAGGRSVAKRISDLLGIPHYDKEIIQLDRPFGGDDPGDRGA